MAASNSFVVPCLGVAIPKGLFGRKIARHDRHLQDHENAEYAQNHAQECKEKRGRLAGEDKPNCSDKDGVRRQVIGQ